MHIITSGSTSLIFKWYVTLWMYCQPSMQIKFLASSNMQLVHEKFHLYTIASIVRIHTSFVTYVLESIFPLNDMTQCCYILMCDNILNLSCQVSVNVLWATCTHNHISFHFWVAIATGAVAFKLWMTNMHW